ncbi:MAG TPA: FAD-binding protein, partial [Mucilaginibacter sp.]
MIKEIEIVCPPGQQDDQEVLKKLSASALKISPQKINAVQVYKRSIDARGRRVVYRMQVKVYVDEIYQPETYTQKYSDVKDAKPV